MLADCAADKTAFGPVRVQGFTASAPDPSGRKDSGLPLLIWRFLRRIVAVHVTGKARRTPFFVDGKPIADLKVLTLEEERNRTQPFRAIARSRREEPPPRLLLLALTHRRCA